MPWTCMDEQMYKRHSHAPAALSAMEYPSTLDTGAGWDPEAVWKTQRKVRWPYQDSNSDPTVAHHAIIIIIVDMRVIRLHSSWREDPSLCVHLRQPSEFCVVFLGMLAIKWFLLLYKTGRNPYNSSPNALHTSRSLAEGQTCIYRWISFYVTISIRRQIAGLWYLVFAWRLRKTTRNVHPGALLETIRTDLKKRIQS
jgi:hypothetical protein